MEGFQRGADAKLAALAPIRSGSTASHLGFQGSFYQQGRSSGLQPRRLLSQRQSFDPAAFFEKKKREPRGLGRGAQRNTPPSGGGFR